jgi:hypothetical protein
MNCLSHREKEAGNTSRCYTHYWVALKAIIAAIGTVINCYPSTTCPLREGVSSLEMMVHFFFDGIKHFQLVAI